VTQESLRAAIAVVPQDISLFHRSIMENIRYGRPDASDADVHEAIVAANCGTSSNICRRALQRLSATGV
jgi:ATP-binding cassette, subfamily B, bacterial